MKNIEKLLISEFIKSAGMKRFLGLLEQANPKALAHTDHAALNMGSNARVSGLPGDVSDWSRGLGGRASSPEDLHFLRQLMGGGEHAELQAATRGAAAEGRAGARHQPNVDASNKRRAEHIKWQEENPARGRSTEQIAKQEAQQSSAAGAKAKDEARATATAKQKQEGNAALKERAETKNVARQETTQGQADKDMSRRIQGIGESADARADLLSRRPEPSTVQTVLKWLKNRGSAGLEQGRNLGQSMGGEGSSLRDIMNMFRGGR
jgi:hypothetical protein